MNVLTETQRRVANDCLHEVSRERRHLVVALSGAHAYGFPSPDSDLDLKAIHIAPTSTFLGLDEPKLTADFMRIVEGVELDYTSNEIGPALRGILSGNGNYLERVLGELILRTSPEHDELVPLCRAALSRRVHHHYRGFAKQQHGAVLREAEPPAKRVLYVLRVALTGIHLLKSGELVADLTELMDEHGFGEARALVEAKRAGELTRLDAAAKARWLGHLERALTMLDAAYPTSCLPPEPPNKADLNAWLVETRRKALD